MMARSSRIISFLTMLLPILIISLMGLGVSSSRQFAHPKDGSFVSNRVSGKVGAGKGGQLSTMEKIGSKPPKCEGKCYGCKPCEAIQVPTSNSQVRVGVQYTNYEPEGWKCKCGHTFYSP